jgi:AraC-like DNA-binding protein
VSRHAPYLTRAVHPALEPYVASLVAYDMALGPSGVHRGLPSTALTFVLPVHEALDVGWSRDPASRGRRWSVLSGLHLAPASIHHNGHQTGVQLGLTAAGARALLGMPSAALCHELAALDELDSAACAVPELLHLPERLHGTDDPLERLLLTHEALLAALARPSMPGPRAEVDRAMSCLTRGSPVHVVADEVGWSRRHLTAQFRAELGLGPKEYQRVARFQLSHRLLLAAARRGRPSLAGVAAEAGYADQAHLAREWSDLAGCSPTRWLSEEFPFLQDSFPRDGQDGQDGADRRRRQTRRGRRR